MPGWKSRWTAGACALLAALACAGGVSAQDRALDEVEETALARSLFRQGIALSDQGRWDEAADRFRRSLSLRESPVVAFNLGTACMHTGRLVEAVELFRRAARDEEADERLRAAASAHVTELEPRLGRLTLEVRGPLDSVTLELDGDRVAPARLGVATPADPGPHVLRALRGGEEVARAELELPESGAAALALEIPPRPVEPAAPALAAVRVAPEVDDPPPAAAGDGWIWFGVIAGVLVVAGAAAVTAALLLDGQGAAPPIEGNLGPSVIAFD